MPYIRHTRCDRRQAPQGYKWVNYHNHCELRKRNQFPNRGVKFGMMPACWDINECTGGWGAGGGSYVGGGVGMNVPPQWGGYSGGNNPVGGGGDGGNGNTNTTNPITNTMPLSHHDVIKQIANSTNNVSAAVQPNTNLPLIIGGLILAVALIAKK